MNDTRLARRKAFVIAIVGTVTCGLALAAVAETAVSPKTKRPVFNDVRAQTTEFIRYADSIFLAPEQEKIKKEVLSSIPAPYCKSFSAATCCCPCNMAKSIWGLSNFMLAHHKANARELRAAVEGWIQVINPAGFTGDACFKGGCSRPFAKNGCGGMDQGRVVF